MSLVLDARTARRAAVAAQLLSAPRPASVLEAIRWLGGAWLGAKDVAYGRALPSAWRRALLA